jgi:hypothetical protein
VPLHDAGEAVLIAQAVTGDADIWQEDLFEAAGA